MAEREFGTLRFSRAEVGEFLAQIRAATSRDLSRHSRRLEAAKDLRNCLDVESVVELEAAIAARRQQLAEGEAWP